MCGSDVLPGHSDWDCIVHPVLQVFVGFGNSRSAVRAGPLCWRFLSSLPLGILVFGVDEGFPT